MFKPARSRNWGIVAATVVTTGSVLVTATPAVAADATSGTEVTFVVNGGGMAISAPSTQSLSAGNPGQTVATTFGSAVTVTDTRGIYAGSWSATASATAFTTTTPVDASPEQVTAATIPASALSYLPGLPDAGALLGATSSGTAVFAPGLGGAMNETGVPAWSATGTVGNNSLAWTPTITVNIPAQALAGTYTGTVTHSVTGS